jgi:hypothetical protein
VSKRDDRRLVNRVILVVGRLLRILPLEHGGEFPDTMPQAIRLVDAEGRSCTCVPITEDGEVVDSQGYFLEEHQ